MSCSAYCLLPPWLAKMYLSYQKVYRSGLFEKKVSIQRHPVSVGGCK